MNTSQKINPQEIIFWCCPDLQVKNYNRNFNIIGKKKIIVSDVAYGTI
jgi:hypothetical protein